MALIVEDGTGLANAESYASVAEFKAYAGKVGYDYTTPAYSDTQVEQALRRATTWIDARYGPLFQGRWATTTQRLEWPRSGVVYRCNGIASDEIPEKLKDALCEAAWRELIDPSSLSPDAAVDQIKRDKVGDAETEFRASSSGSHPVVFIVHDLLSGLTKGRASAYVGRAVRA
ncbi:hypothetical protein MNR02_06620 [Shinella sp. H4-D48]|uniref:DnaT-like ssDNA-binding protein n=1 Tax=Shinella sp. H4-D48 TaxID=2925841 RepID=UPI001F532F42|nr:DnaT-like ssDNA-binding protein [Shinella sp. H4-D48]UNK39375.1 hypothetical protein MNR02_06620 [Shinella sp. H4-D48]